MDTFESISNIPYSDMSWNQRRILGVNLRWKIYCEELESGKSKAAAKKASEDWWSNYLAKELWRERDAKIEKPKIVKSESTSFADEISRQVRKKTGRPRK